MSKAITLRSCILTEACICHYRFTVDVLPAPADLRRRLTSRIALPVLLNPATTPGQPAVHLRAGILRPSAGTCLGVRVGPVQSGRHLGRISGVSKWRDDDDVGRLSVRRQYSFRSRDRLVVWTSHPELNISVLRYEVGGKNECGDCCNCPLLFICQITVPVINHYQH